MLVYIWSLVLLCSSARASTWIQYPSDGYATMTHYTLPLNFIPACGCVTNSTLYPTAAMSQMAYGSSQAYGPACGSCFNLTLVDAFLVSPKYYPNVTRSVVVKITDLCPLSKAGWCDPTTSKPNDGGAYINFDLSWPSTSISSDFFPSNATEYGYTDFGVWNVSYQVVSCQSWLGWNHTQALGSVASEGLGYDSCCPDDPSVNPNSTCPSYSDEHNLS
ncbi:hypothetical protein CONPUDRAFT_51844 [Coniophora puteana RWD-64-598 SS2]|uniref:Expansin-like EG45 domain-containing protein n=1 Tax=Coniophora puteana (strain RWD-64-598) TaxID=741705 RepID=A0A5M3MWA2_CONPW|nr:uncharacterized protein CONPUDRAFT_51844 [Coniophora puteana RWD-64-598 SS2]EIW82871.1 hypothetical protein CONPUDRAFT_51844 [Coniophora puteana RWD-64-598 SS2]